MSEPDKNCDAAERLYRDSTENPEILEADDG